MEILRPLTQLKDAIETILSPVPDKEWRRFLKTAKNISKKKYDVIFRQTEICREVIYLTDGIAASEYVLDGRSSINRFFLKGSFCTNLISLATGQPDCDNIISLTALQGVIVPVEIFIEYYNEDSTIGRFIRDKVLQTLVEDKSITSAKTLLTKDALDQFIRDTYPEVISRIPSKYIAQFMGITPEAYSRLLKRRLQKT